MDMHAFSMRWALIALALLGVAGLLAGCGATSGTTSGGGYGSDSGPWPTAPNRATGTTATRPAGNEPPTAPLYVVLRGKSADAETLKLAVASVEVKFEDSWTPVANKSLITAQETLPLTLGAKGTTCLLAKTDVPRRKYSHLRLRVDDAETALVRDDKKTALTLQTSVLTLAEWTPAEGKANLIILTVDGTKVTHTDDSATLPADAITVTTGLATGGVSGKMTPALPTARVEAFWGSSTTPIAGANPSAEDGAFTIENLPPGSYRIEVRAPGHRLIEPLTDPIAIDAKVVPLRKLDLTAN